MDDSVYGIIDFPVWPLPETVMGLRCSKCLVGCLTMNTIGT